jgi:hypothetical protein
METELAGRNAAVHDFGPERRLELVLSGDRPTPIRFAKTA